MHCFFWVRVSISKAGHFSVKYISTRELLARKKQDHAMDFSSIFSSIFKFDIGLFHLTDHYSLGLGISRVAIICIQAPMH